MVSAVILSYNRCSEVLFTVDMLKSMRNEIPFELEIIVVDNASADDTSAQIRQKHPDIVLITKAMNNGIAGWNEGFKVAKHKYFLVLDDDSHVHSGLPGAIQRMEEHGDIGILPFQILDKDLGADPNLNPEEAWKDNDEVVGFIGCGAIIRKELYDKIGGFAEWIYVYTHEFEYSIRCLNAGYRINFFGKGIVIHRTSNINRSSRRMRIFATRNELCIIHKYFTGEKSKYLIRVFINNLKFIKREGLQSGYYVVQGGIAYLKLRKRLNKTPVSLKVQDYFANNFWSTKPIFNNKLNNLTSE